MKVPEDVTLLWCDDNFGYIRQLSTPDEQNRPGASGIYYHISYLGGPRSYTWLNTTPPVLIWEEMTKAYDYGADRVWVVNVGDIKPGEIGMDFWLRLAWNIHAYDNNTIPQFLVDFATQQFGPDEARAIASVLNDYYRLGFGRKPEAMDTDSFSTDEMMNRMKAYDQLRSDAENINNHLSADKRDAFYELVLYPVRICALIAHEYFGDDSLTEINAETSYYNQVLAGGKWRDMMTVKGTTNPTYAFKWPDPKSVVMNFYTPKDPIYSVLAEHFTRNLPRAGAQWQTIAGLGHEKDSMAVFPTTAPSIADFSTLTAQSPEMDYNFDLPITGKAQVSVYAIPTHRINSTRGLRYAVAIDDEQPQIVDFEHSASDNSRAWQEDVIRNINVTVTNHTLADPGKHTLKIFMVDPGVVLEKLVVSHGPLPPSELGPPETVRK
jgi:hypothetical protein